VLNKNSIGSETNSLSSVNRNLGNIFHKSQEDYRIMKKNGFSNPLAILLRKNASKLGQFFSIDYSSKLKR
jgi:hypothetical protein